MLVCTNEDIFCHSVSFWLDKIGTRGAREVHERGTRGAREVHERGTFIGNKRFAIFFILTHLGHDWDTGTVARKVHERCTRWAREVHERCTRGAQEGHKRGTRGVLEGHFHGL